MTHFSLFCFVEGMHAWFALEGWEGFSGGWSDRAFDRVPSWGSGRVDIELIALAAQDVQ